MRLTLSSAAAPGAALDELLEACARRGLAGVELEQGHGHGLDPATTDPAAAGRAAQRVRAAGLMVAGYRLASGVVPADGERLATFGRALGAPLILPPGDAAAGEADPILRLLEALPGQGVPVALVVESAWGDPGDGGPAHPSSGGLSCAYDPARLHPSVTLAWDADPTRGDVAAPLAGGRSAGGAGPRLMHVRLMGGGPEASQHEGRGVGALMARLALAGYGGTVALAPSSTRYRVIWDAWLGRRGGWGCGSRKQDPRLVSLAPAGAGVAGAESPAAIPDSGQDPGEE